MSFTQTSDNWCSDEANYSFSATVNCDESITGQGNAKILTVANSTASPCSIHVTVAHAAGCPLIDTLGFARFNEENPWVMGLVMLIGGPLVALFGLKWFPYVSAGIGSVIAFMGTMVLVSVFGWMETTVGLVLCLILAVALGVLCGWIMYKTVRIAVGILGAIGGYFLGTLIYTFLLAAFDWSALWAMITFSVIFAILGGLASFKWAKTVVLTCTSGIGSYAFMRGLSSFFGGYPSEAILMQNLKEGTDTELTWAFWVYFAIFIAATIGSIWFQSVRNKQEVHERLQQDEGYNRQQ